MIIGFAGLKRCGKDTATLYLLEHLKAKQVMLAEPIKLGLMAMFGFTWEQVNGEGYDRDQPTEYGPSIREMLQTLGTEWGRNMVCKNVWLMLQLKKMQEEPDVLYIMSDVRFDNEAELVRAHGVLVHIETPNAPKPEDDHPSERGVAFKEGDKVLVNRKDGKGNYYREIDKLLKEIYKQ